MSAATLPVPTIQPGAIVDLGEHCPRRCVTWDVDETCWGLERTRMKPRRPGTVPFRAIAPITDPEAWMAEPTTLVAVPALPPPGPPRPPIAAAVAAGEPNPDPVTAVFGQVEVVYDLESFRKRVEALLRAQRQRDPAVLDLPVWARLVEVVEAGAGGDALPVAVRAVIGWCQEEDPGRLKLGGWVNLVAQVEAFEGRWVQQVRLEPWVPPSAT